jgi:preprotein translocase subunit SecB
LNKFKNGKAHISGRDTIERVGNLLGIHKSLRILYPYNRAVVYTWIKAKNKKLHNLTPLEVMLSEGYIGIAQVRKLTDYMRGI